MKIVISRSSEGIYMDDKGAKIQYLATVLFKQNTYPTLIKSPSSIINFSHLMGIWSETGSTRFLSEISHIKIQFISEEGWGIRPVIEVILESLKGPPREKFRQLHRLSYGIALTQKALPVFLPMSGENVKQIY
jgi:hypothetical protein